MEPEFWHERWHEGRIAFHQSEVNRFLRRHLARLAGPVKGPIFVPLCGKSRDMLWLREQGHAVVGVELSPLAVEAFYQEAGWAAARRGREAFLEYQGGGVTILLGNYFDLTPSLVGPISAVYDRAALIALPTRTRKAYAAHMAALTSPGTPLLLVAPFSLKDPESGPPFAVSRDEVEALFSPHFTVEVLESARETVADKPGLASQGLAWREETAYLLTRRLEPLVT